MKSDALPPVIAIDGPTASGKGTLAQRVAGALAWHYLDSGALYRLVALAALRGLGGTQAREILDVRPAGPGAGEPAQRVAAQRSPAPDGEARGEASAEDGGEARAEETGEAGLARLAVALPVGFEGDRILLAGDDVTEAIRAEPVGNAASMIAVMPAVRQALVARQKAFRRPPGLVADGRDMGTVIFPDASLKVFLTASPESRADRRHKQLIEKGFSVTLPNLLQDLRERDRRDATRAVAPLVPAEDALVVDSTTLDIDETVARVLQAWRTRGRR